eukprot:gene38845-47242_t
MRSPIAVESEQQVVIASHSPSLILHPATVQDTLNNQSLYRFPMNKALRCMLLREYQYSHSLVFSVWDILYAAFASAQNEPEAVCIQDLSFTHFQINDIEQLTRATASIWVSVDLNTSTGFVWFKEDKNSKYLLANFKVMHEISQAETAALCKKFSVVNSYPLAFSAGLYMEKNTTVAESLQEAFKTIDSDIEICSIAKTTISQSKYVTPGNLLVSFIVRPGSNLVDILCRKPDNSLVVAVYGATVKTPKLSHVLLVEDWMDNHSSALKNKASFDLSKQMWFADNDDQYIFQDEVVTKLPNLFSVEALFESSISFTEQVVVSGNSLYKWLTTKARKVNDIGKILKTKLFPLIEVMAAQRSSVVFTFNELMQAQKAHFSFFQFREVVSNLIDCARLEGTESSLSVLVMEKSATINSVLVSIERMMKISMQYNGFINNVGIMQSKCYKALPDYVTVKSRFKAETAIITGGLGGLGLLTAKVLVTLGARHLFLVSRSGRIAHEGQGLEEDLAWLQSQAGVQVDILSYDVSREEEVQGMLWEVRGRSAGGRIDGIIHAAGVLRDALIRGGGAAAGCEEVWNAKALSAWWLHKHTQEDELQFFVCYSSLAAAFGNVGQSAYGAANRYLDVLMEERRRLGLVGTSIRWPAISGKGMVASLLMKSEAMLSLALSVEDFNSFLRYIILSTVSVPTLTVCPNNLCTLLLESQRTLLDSSIAEEVGVAHDTGVGTGATPVDAKSSEPTQSIEDCQRVVRDVILYFVQQHEGFNDDSNLLSSGLDSFATMEAAARLSKVFG